MAMPTMNRRQFMRANLAGGAALAAGSLAPGAATAPYAPTREGDHAFVDRIAFGTWMNDTRIDSLPFAQWPANAVDDVTVDSIIRTFDLDRAYGYNIYDIFGLFATWGGGGAGSIPTRSANCTHPRTPHPRPHSEGVCLWAHFSPPRRVRPGIETTCDRGAGASCRSNGKGPPQKWPSA